MAWDQPCLAILWLVTDLSLSHTMCGSASTAASCQQQGLYGLQGKPLLMLSTFLLILLGTSGNRVEGR